MAIPFSWAQLLPEEKQPEEGGNHDARLRLAARLETVKDSEGCTPHFATLIAQRLKDPGALPQWRRAEW